MDRHASLDALVTRPDRPGRFPLAMINAVCRATGKDAARDARELLRAGGRVRAAWLCRGGGGTAWRRHARPDYRMHGFGALRRPTLPHRRPRRGRDILWRRLASLRHVAMGRSGPRRPRRTFGRRLCGTCRRIERTGGRHRHHRLRRCDSARRGPSFVCQPERLVETMHEYGTRTHIPSLWIFAANDGFFGPQLARQMFDAIRPAGRRRNSTRRRHSTVMAIC